MLAGMMAEAKLSQPLQGWRPSELDMIKHWKEVRLHSDIALTNVFNLHPDGDQTELFFDSKAESDLPPFRIGAHALRLKPEYRPELTRLYSEIDSHRPNLIIALGNFASWATVGKTKISEIRGTIHQGYNGVKVLPTYHPAAAVPSRNVELRPDIVADLIKAKREAEFPEIRRIKRWITAECPQTKERVTIAEIEQWFQTPSLSYAIDIESGRALFTDAELKAMSEQMRRILASLISMVSFARSDTEAVVIPFMTRDDPELNYWSDSDETQAWEIVRRELDSETPKTFQNGLYDITHFLRINLRVRNCTDDTMILTHAIFPERRKGLGYLGSLFSDEISWKQMRSGGESIKREE